MSKKEEIDQFVEQHVREFSTGLTKLLREAVHETVDAALGSYDAPAKARKVKRQARAKAKPEAVDASSELLAAVRANSGSGTGAIAKAVGQKPVQIRPLLAALVKAGSIKKGGKGRGTTYSVR